MFKIMRSAKNSSLSSVAEDAEVGSRGGDCEDKTGKILPSTNLNGATGYLTPDARQTFIQLGQIFTKAPIH